MKVLAQELDTVGNVGQIVTGIAIFAPTNAAVEGTLAYLVGTKSYIEHDEINKQLSLDLWCVH